MISKRNKSYKLKFLEFARDICMLCLHKIKMILQRKLIVEISIGLED